MNTKRSLIVVLLTLVTLLLAACGGTAAITGTPSGNVAIDKDQLVMQPDATFCISAESSVENAGGSSLTLDPGVNIVATSVVTINLTTGEIQGEIDFGTCAASATTDAASSTPVPAASPTVTNTVVVDPAATPAPATAPEPRCPTSTDIENLGNVEYWLYEGGQVSGAHLTFGKNFTATDVEWGWAIDAIHKDSKPVPMINAGFQASIWVKTVCRPIEMISAPVATPVAATTPAPATCNALSITELQALAAPGTTFEVLLDKGIAAGAHMTFAKDFAKPCWVDQIQKDAKSWDVAPAGAEVSLWLLPEHRPLH